MPREPTGSPEQFIQGAPVLQVQDVLATAAFYRDVLGFDWDFGDEEYCVVWRDNSAIHFARGDGDVSGLHLFQWVRDVDALHEEVTAKGAVVAVELASRSYGVRDFKITDPNGVGLVFGQAID